jgi:dephospho-CoA kinase
MDADADIFRRCAALTGSIASGKSTVAGFLIEMGAGLVDTDKIAREIVAKGSFVLNEISSAFGNEVLLKDGNLDRTRLRSIIINDQSAREKLNSIMHPVILKKASITAAGLIYEGRLLPVFVDVPLLFEAGWNRYFDEIVMVYAPRRLQIERLMLRDGCGIDEAEAIVSAQISTDEKKAMARYVIDNGGAVESAKLETAAVLKAVGFRLSG